MPINGDALYTSLAQKLLFGETNPLVVNEQIVTVQALSGTGALRVGFEFLSTHIPGEVLISNPTWSNHFSIVRESGLKFVEYPYFHPATKGLDYEGIFIIRWHMFVLFYVKMDAN